jgi:hypothetical protein
VRTPERAPLARQARRDEGQRAAEPGRRGHQERGPQRPGADAGDEQERPGDVDELEDDGIERVGRVAQPGRQRVRDGGQRERRHDAGPVRQRGEADQRRARDERRREQDETLAAAVDEPAEHGRGDAQRDGVRRRHQAAGGVGAGRPTIVAR